jgi:hypothetical protein
MAVTLNMTALDAAITEWNLDDGLPEYHKRGLDDYSGHDEQLESLYWDLQSLLYERGHGELFHGIKQDHTRLYALKDEDGCYVLIGVELEPYEGFVLYGTPAEVRKLGDTDNIADVLDGVAAELDRLQQKARRLR